MKTNKQEREREREREKKWQQIGEAISTVSSQIWKVFFPDVCPKSWLRPRFRDERKKVFFSKPHVVKKSVFFFIPKGWCLQDPFMHETGGRGGGERGSKTSRSGRAMYWKISGEEDKRKYWNPLNFPNLGSFISNPVRSKPIRTFTHVQFNFLHSN